MPTQTFLKKVGRNIKDARLRAGLRQIDVNELAGLTYRHYQNIEAGKINMTLVTLCRLSKAFGVSIKELLEEC